MGTVDEKNVAAATAATLYPAEHTTIPTITREEAAAAKVRVINIAAATGKTAPEVVNATVIGGNPSQAITPDTLASLQAEVQATGLAAGPHVLDQTAAVRTYYDRNSIAAAALREAHKGGRVALGSQITTFQQKTRVEHPAPLFNPVEVGPVPVAPHWLLSSQVPPELGGHMGFGEQLFAVDYQEWENTWRGAKTYANALKAWEARRVHVRAVADARLLETGDPLSVVFYFPADIAWPAVRAWSQNAEQQARALRQKQAVEVIQCGDDISPTDALSPEEVNLGLKIASFNDALKGVAPFLVKSSLDEFTARAYGEREAFYLKKADEEETVRSLGEFAAMFFLFVGVEWASLRLLRLADRVRTALGLTAEASRVLSVDLTTGDVGLRALEMARSLKVWNTAVTYAAFAGMNEATRALEAGRRPTAENARYQRLHDTLWDLVYSVPGNIPAFIVLTGLSTLESVLPEIDEWIRADGFARFKAALARLARDTRTLVK